MTGMAVPAFLGVLDQIIPIFQGEMSEKLQAGYSIQLLISSLQTDVILLVLPILAALPFTTAFVDDYRSKYLREYLPRAGKRQYIISKISATAIAGGLTLFVGILLVCFVFTLLLSPMEIAPQAVTDNTAMIEANAIDITALWT